MLKAPEITEDFHFQPMLEEAGLLPMKRHINFDERPAGALNVMWYNIARPNGKLMQQSASVLGQLALELRSEGLETGAQLANALQNVSSPEAYHPVQAYRAPASGMVGTCPAAEGYFAMINRGSSSSESDMGGYVVLHHKDEPILVEKNYRGVSSSALSLKEIVVNDVPYPPGFIFGVTHHETTEVQAATTANGHMVLAADASDIRHLQPRRLSIYGIPVEERSLVANDLLQMQDEANADADNWTIDTYRAMIGTPEIHSDSYLVTSEVLANWNRQMIAPILSANSLV